MITKRTIEALGSLYSVQALNYLIPLFTLPYLAYRLGPTHFGMMAFAEAYANTTLLAIEYGFAFSATRKLAREREQTEQRSKALSSVLTAQLALVLVACVITALLTALVPAFRYHKSLIPGALLWAVAQGLSPLWYFLAIERVRFISALTLTTRIIAASSVLMFVHGPGDDWIPLTGRGLGAILSTILGLWLASRDAPFVRVTSGEVKTVLSEGWAMFLYRSSTGFYTSSAVIVLGFVASPRTVGLYAGAEKIVRAGIGGMVPLAQTYYPQISNLLGQSLEAARRALRTSAMLTLGLGAAITAAILCAAPVAVSLILGSGYEGSITPLRILGLLPLTVAATNLLTVQWMIPLSLDAELNRIVVLAAVANCTCVYAFGTSMGQSGAAISVVSAEFAVLLLASTTLSKNGLHPLLSRHRAILQCAAPLPNNSDG